MTKPVAKLIDLKMLSGVVNLNAEANSDKHVKVLGMVRAKATVNGPAIEYGKAVEFRMNKLGWVAVHPKIEVGTIAGTLRVVGEELACRIGNLFLTARLVDDRFVLSGGHWGEHSLDASAAITSADRLIAHWRGYCENNARQIGGSL